MTLLRVDYLEDGPGPAEKVVSIKTRSGPEEVVLSSRTKSDYISVGETLARENGYVLVELPRESASGKWRVWVPETETKDELLQAAE